MNQIEPTKRPKEDSFAGQSSARKPSRAKASTSRAVGVLLFAIAPIILLVEWRAGAPSTAFAAFAAFVAMPALSWLGAEFIIAAKQQAAPSAHTLLAQDQRPPVLYFRSFTADRTTAKGVTIGAYVTEEEQLAKTVQGVGPFVAIGEPGESLPDIGAARFYVPDEEWRRAVHDLLSKASLVILRLGSSPGFTWEFETALRLRRPEQLLLLVPRDEHLYEDFRQRRHLLPCELPPLTDWRRHKRLRGSLQAAIFFDPDWTPNIVNLQTLSLPLLRRSPKYPLVPVLQTALAPLSHNLDLPWQPPGYNWHLILLITWFLLQEVTIFIVTGPGGQLGDGLMGGITVVGAGGDPWRVRGLVEGSGGPSAPGLG